MAPPLFVTALRLCLLVASSYDVNERLFCRPKHRRLHKHVDLERNPPPLPPKPKNWRQMAAWASMTSFIETTAGVVFNVLIVAFQSVCSRFSSFYPFHFLFWPFLIFSFISSTMCSPHFLIYRSSDLIHYQVPGTWYSFPPPTNVLWFC